MAIAVFGRTQNALQTPFEPLRNPGYGGLPQPFVSTDVQNAIEEALDRAISNDRFLILSSYGGNANTGRYLEFFPGIDSSEAPILFVTTTRVLSIVARTTSVSATADIGFFDLNVSSVTPVYTVTFSAVKQVTLSGSPLFSLPVNALLGIRVTSGSINKPHLYFTLSASA